VAAQKEKGMDMEFQQKETKGTEIFNRKRQPGFSVFSVSFVIFC
jgi:hypothetical protein